MLRPKDLERNVERRLCIGATFTKIPKITGQDRLIGRRNARLDLTIDTFSHYFMGFDRTGTIVFRR